MIINDCFMCIAIETARDGHNMISPLYTPVSASTWSVESMLCGRPLAMSISDFFGSDRIRNKGSPIHGRNRAIERSNLRYFLLPNSDGKVPKCTQMCGISRIFRKMVTPKKSSEARD